MKKVVTIVLAIMIITTVFSPVAFAKEEPDINDAVSIANEVETTTESQKTTLPDDVADDETDYLKQTQGLEEYYQKEFTDIDTWYNELPEYSGELLSIILDKTVLETRELTKNTSEVGRNAALLKMSTTSENDDPRFKFWLEAKLTVPKEIYNLDNTIYGYIYGVVNGKKLVGYIVAGASKNAPPVLEYGLDADKYLYLMNEEKVYFGRASGYLLKKGDIIVDISQQQMVCNTKELSGLIEKNIPENYEQKALDEEWSKAETLAITLDAQKDEVKSVVSSTQDPHSVPNAETSGSIGTKTYIGMDTCDYTWYNICSLTTMSMYFDALARRIVSVKWACPLL